MQIIFSYLKTNKKLLVYALVLATINQVFSLLDPQIFRLIVDNYALKAGELTQAEFIRGVGLLLFGLMFVAFISRTAKAFQDYYVNVMTETMGTEMYADSVEHVFALPYSVFEDERSGSILLNLQKARDNAKALIQSYINVVFISLIGLIFVIAYAFYVHWLAAISYILIIPVIGLSGYYLSQSIKPAQQKIVRESAELSGSTTETLRNVSLVKSLGLESQEVKRLNDTNEQVLDLELKKVILLRKLSYIQGTLTNAVRVAITFVMMYLIYTGAVTLGEFMTLLFYSFFIFQPLGQVSDVVAKYQEATASSEELERILSLKIDEEVSIGEEIGKIESMEFKNVSFSYQNTQGAAIKNINFKATAGETIAFVGPSGSGKSTIIKLLVGLYSPKSGEYLINSRVNSKLNMSSFKSKLGFVSQETQLFAGTIAENLRFVAPEATNDELVEALEQAQVEYILKRGDENTGIGLQTKIGETGIKLSGGERQRLSIARALLRKPDVLIFDEATSSLDTLTEQAITKTIENIREKRKDLILVLVAHRLSTIASADRIYVLGGGEMKEEGGLKTLTEKGGLFSLMWKEQTQGV